MTTTTNFETNTINKMMNALRNALSPGRLRADDEDDPNLTSVSEDLPQAGADNAQASADAGAAADTEVQADVTADANTPEQLTTVDGFDLEKVQTMIDTSDLPATQKTLLKQGLVTAGENPDALRAILARIREALAL